MVLSWPQWSVVAAEVASGVPAAVVHANRVLAISSMARHEGVRVGMRRREAQSRCPSVEIIAHDLARDARRFEAVVAAIEPLTPMAEVLAPGRVAFATRGPSRYWGGDEALAALVLRHVRDAIHIDTSVNPGPGVGIAASRFAATLAAVGSAGDATTCGGTRGDDTMNGTVVPLHHTPQFLAPIPVSALSAAAGVDAGFVELLGQLGVTTLGALAAFDRADLLARFGPLGHMVHRLATGEDDRPLDARRPPPDVVVQSEIDPPADRVDRVAFLAKVLAEQLHEMLAGRGLACTRLAIEAETEHGERSSRLWRHEGALSVAAITERVRWQLDGWLTAAARDQRAAATAGIALLRLVPDEVVPDSGRQLGFWGGRSDDDDRALRAVARLSAMVGRDGVQVAEWRGGRGPAEQLVLVPADSVDLVARLDGRPVVPVQIPPWPGQLPTPSPAVVMLEPIPAEVIDAHGATVRVNGRQMVEAEPARFRVEGGSWRQISAWAGPWCVQERWWDADNHRRRARFQLLDESGRAVVAVLEGGRWWIEADYA